MLGGIHLWITGTNESGMIFIMAHFSLCCTRSVFFFFSYHKALVNVSEIKEEKINPFIFILINELNLSLSIQKCSTLLLRIAYLLASFLKVTTQAPFFPAGIQIGEFSDECKCNYKKWWVSWTQFRYYTFSKGREEKKEKREAYITYGLNFFWISKPWQLIVSKHVLDKYLTQQCKVLQLGEN